MRREFLDQVLFWNGRDLERKLAEFQAYYNAARCHASLDGHTPLTFAGGAHGGPCRSEPGALGLPLPGPRPAPSRRLTTNSRPTRTIVTPTSVWQRLSLLYTADATGNLGIHLERQSGLGTLSWDDVRVEPAPPNGDFEAGSLSGWTVWSPDPGFSPTTSQQGPHGGRFSLAEATPGIVYQGIGGLTPGRSYLVSAWVTASAGANAPAKLFVHNTEGPNASRTIVTPTSKWQRLSLLYTADATGNLGIHLQRQSGLGTLYWDDVRVEPAPPMATSRRGHWGGPCGHPIRVSRRRPVSKARTEAGLAWPKPRWASSTRGLAG